MKKTILILVLLVPAGTFLFLKFFGKNEFDIPVYYQEGVELPPADCHRAYETPYLVPAALLNNIGWHGRPLLLVTDSSSVVQKGIMSLEEGIRSVVQTIFLEGKKNDQIELVTCDLLLKSPFTVVLIDDQRRIRGYYNPEDREELDRLTVELEILIKQY